MRYNNQLLTIIFGCPLMQTVAQCLALWCIVLRENDSRPNVRTACKATYFRVANRDVHGRSCGISVSQCAGVMSSVNPDRAAYLASSKSCCARVASLPVSFRCIAA